MEGITSNRITFPTPYPDINIMISRLLSEVQSILSASFIGLYLHGSLANGDFNPRSSDIDFLVVTDSNLPIETISNLKDMHAFLFSSRLAWSQKLEGAYLPKGDLRCHDPANAPIPWLGMDGHFAFERLGSDWIIQRHILREKGIVVFGPPLMPMIDLVSAEDLREAVRGSLRDWWSPPFPSPERFNSDKYQAFAILTMCRSLFVLKFGAVASKPAAARWAQSMLGEPWNVLIAEAADLQNEMKFDKFEETMGLIRFTLERYGLCATI